MVKELSVNDTYRMLQKSSSALLVDCRTLAEWQLVGVADLSEIGKRPIQIEWQDLNGQLNPNFCTQVAEHAEKDTPIFVICRSGGRSESACRALMAAGYGNCVNVIDGFEGPVDANGHRNTLGGWRANGLPWRQG